MVKQYLVVKQYANFFNYIETNQFSWNFFEYITLLCIRTI